MSYPQFSGYTLGTLVQEIGNLETNLMNSLTGSLEVSDDLVLSKDIAFLINNYSTDTMAGTHTIVEEPIFLINKKGKVKLVFDIFLDGSIGNTMESRTTHFYVEIYDRDVLVGTLSLVDLLPINTVTYDNERLTKDIEVFVTNNTELKVRFKINNTNYVSNFLTDWTFLENSVISLNYQNKEYVESEVII